MEDKRLNFNRPLLSVRRFSSTVASQKDSKRKNGTSIPTIPRTPSYKHESQLGPLRKPGNVPFVWEHSPGRPKDETKTQKQPPSIPKLPPGRILKPKKQDLDIITRDSNVKKGPGRESLGPQSVLPIEEKLTKFESSKGTTKERSDSDDDDGEMYMDALDTPPLNESDVNNSGIHSTDQNRHFLLAAKTMASGAPQPAPREHVFTEKSREAKKVVNWENKKPQLTYGPNFLQFTAHDNEEDSDFDYDDHENMSYEVCGLLPHFCLKGSIGLINPVPGLSMRTKLPISRRTRVASSSASFEPARVGVYEHKSLGKHQKDPTVSKNNSTKTTNPKPPQNLEKLGPYNRLEGRVISNNLTEPSQPPVSERKEANSHKKPLVSFKELLAEENEKETHPQSPTLEKTLYVDTIHSSTKNGPSEFKETDEGISGILQMGIQTDFCKDPKVDQESNTKVRYDMNPKSEFPAPPPLPKSPSDSWLWRTLPSLSSKNTSLHANPKYPTPKSYKHVELRDSQGLLPPIPET